MKAFPRPTIILWLLLASGTVGRMQSQTGADPAIGTARAEAAAFSKSLPDYVAHRITTRFTGSRLRFIDGTRVTPNLELPEIGWKKLDVVTADLVAVGGKEVYSNVKVDDEPAGNPAVTGAWSSGEFSGILNGLFDSHSAAVFSNQRRETIGRRAVLRYKFAIDHDHSQWMIDGKNSSWTTAYGGDVWIDRETGKTLRIDMSARDLPDKVSLDVIESSVEYVSFRSPAKNMYCLSTPSS